MNAVTIKNLTKTYQDGTKALDGINLTIKEGDFYALVGANGAGKTTIIGIMTDLINKSSGEITIFNKNIETNLNKIKLKTGVVPQEFNFGVFENVINIITTQAGYFGVPRKTALKRAEEVLKELNLWEKRNVRSASLSGGMKRRLMIARALIHKPKLLILDEPTAGVDVELRHSMWKYLKKLNKQGTTILLTTHYLEEVEQMCNRMSMIKDGKIIKEGSVKKIIQSLDKKEYIINSKNSLPNIKNCKYKTSKIDETTLEIELTNKEPLNSVLADLHKHQIEIIDIRPKQNRIEQFFLEALKK